VLNDLGLKPNVTNGGNSGLLGMFASLESALNTNNVTTIQGMLDIADYNLDKLSKIRGDVGSLTNKLESSESFEIELGSKLEKDLSNIEDIDIAKIGQEYTNAQTALQAAIQTTSNFFQYSLRGLSGFLGG
jgi:flagellin-like hook-associated protein FlgL